MTASKILFSNQKETFNYIGMILSKSRFIFIVLPILFFTSCVTNQFVPERETTVAVWDLEDLTPIGSGRNDFGEPLSSKVIETLKESSKWILVERERLLIALDELNLGTSSMVDESTGLRIGNVIGVQLMVFGAYQVVGGMMRLDLRLVDVETGKIRKAVQATTSGTDLSKWLNAAEKAARELLKEATSEK